MRWIIAAAMAATLASCSDDEDRGAWYPTMTCQERDLQSGRCIKAEYSCPRDGTAISYRIAGVRCIVRSTP